MKSGGPKRLRFVQLYTSKSYENRRGELVNPPTDENNDNENSNASSSGSLRRSSSTENLQKHVLSPRLVDAISKTTQVVWATSKKQEGLIGRSDIRLQTAVGMPVAMDAQGNMCVVVMFSPNNIQSTDDAMEYLQSISRSATSSTIPGLFPVFDPNTSRMKQLTHPDINSSICSDANALGEGVTARFVSLDDHHGDDMEAEIYNEHELTDAPKDTFGIPMLPTFAEVGNAATDYDSGEIFDEASYGIWSTIMEALKDDPLVESYNSVDFDFNESDSALIAEAAVVAMSSDDSGLKVVLPNKASMSESRKIRLEEFCTAFLDMSVFDLADVWVPAGKDHLDCLRHVTSVTGTDKNALLEDSMSNSASTLIKFWTGAVGRAYSSGNPVWSASPNVFIDPGRAEHFKKTKIMTVLAVPVFSAKSAIPACVVACYSLVQSGSVPFVLRFVQQALRLLWDGLDKVEPHESVGRNLWQDVAPADLGEMAADVEMQQHFISKKRPHTVIAESECRLPSARPDATAAAIASHSQAVRLPNGDTVTLPLQLSEFQTVNMTHVQNHVYEALRSVAWAIPFDRVSTNADDTKRAHVLPMRPLPMPQRFPTTIVSSSSQFTRTAEVEAPRRTIEPVTVNAAVFVFPPQPSFIGMSEMKNQFLPAQQALVDFNSLPMSDLNLYCMPTDSSCSGSEMDMEISSGDVRNCRIQGCDELAASRRPYCVKHSGSRLCEFDGCNKCAQGSTRFCIAHGGGRRCTHPGCDKGARDKFFCAAHGGGKRCRFDGCNKSAVGGSAMCTAHGGGRRCDVEGCDKSAQSSTKYCVKHGGGKKCAQDGCDKVARGRTQYCAAHGGGVRCKLEGCNRVAIGKLQLCRAHGGGARTKKNRVLPSPSFGTSSIML